jgi:hypothetical protein
MKLKMPLVQRESFQRDCNAVESAVPFVPPKIPITQDAKLQHLKRQGSSLLEWNKKYQSWLRTDGPEVNMFLLQRRACSLSFLMISQAITDKSSRMVIQSCLGSFSSGSSRLAAVVHLCSLLLVSLGAIPDLEMAWQTENAIEFQAQYVLARFDSCNGSSLLQADFSRSVFSLSLIISKQTREQPYCSSTRTQPHTPASVGTPKTSRR